MTELETMQRAKMYLDKLAQGIDPISGREVQEDSVLNNVRLARCFFYVSGLLEQMIANGGEIGVKHRIPFTIAPEQLRKVQPSRDPVRVSQLVEMISAAVDNPQMKKLSTTVITNWLLEKGFLEKQTDPEGKTKRMPTRNGMMIGLSSEPRVGPNGEYRAVFYSTAAQQFVLDNLIAILAERENRDNSPK